RAPAAPPSGRRTSCAAAGGGTVGKLSLGPARPDAQPPPRPEASRGGPDAPRGAGRRSASPSCREIRCRGGSDHARTCPLEHEAGGGLEPRRLVEQRGAAGLAEAEVATDTPVDDLLAVGHDEPG